MYLKTKESNLTVLKIQNKMIVFQKYILKWVVKRGKTRREKLGLAGAEE